MNDYVIRATSANGEVRAFVAKTRDMVEAAREAHGTSKVATAALGRTLTVTSMMGLMMKNKGDELTSIVKGGGPIGTILATSDAHGFVRGYVSNPDVEVENYPNGKLNVAGAVGNDGTIKVIKDLGLRDPVNGVSPIVTGEIAEDFTYYFTASEQTPSAVSLGVYTTHYEVEHAGGFIVQLMPDATEETISQLEQNIGKMKSITEMYREGLEPEDVLELVLNGLNPTILDKVEVGFRCVCSKDRVKKAFIAMGKKSLAEIIEEDHEAEVTCQFCSKKYNYTEDELLEILKEM